MSTQRHSRGDALLAWHTHHLPPAPRGDLCATRHRAGCWSNPSPKGGSADTQQSPQDKAPRCPSTAPSRGNGPGLPFFTELLRKTRLENCNETSFVHSAPPLACAVSAEVAPGTWARHLVVQHLHFQRDVFQRCILCLPPHRMALTSTSRSAVQLSASPCSNRNTFCPLSACRHAFTFLSYLLEPLKLAGFLVDACNFIYLFFYILK